ncbi:MAG: hypothetical protein V1910_02710 [bacterium]
MSFFWFFLIIIAVINIAFVVEGYLRKKRFSHLQNFSRTSLKKFKGEYGFKEGYFLKNIGRF